MCVRGVVWQTDCDCVTGRVQRVSMYMHVSMSADVVYRSFAVVHM